MRRVGSRSFEGGAAEAGEGPPPRGSAPGARTALAAASYTLVAAAQKASGFVLLILFTRVLSPSEYGQVALLTTVGALLVMVLSLGLEPRIIYAYFRSGDDLPDYLRAARRVTFGVPVLVGAVLVLVFTFAPVGHQLAWMMECAGSCLLAAGTTYAYSVLRAGRRVGPYMTLALGILVTQVVTRVVFVAVLDWGPTGWAASDLAGGLVAVLVGRWTVRGMSVGRISGKHTAWSVTREGLPLVPHYLAQWGLSLSDRLVLALFVSTAAVGVYSAIYQIAAVTSLVLNEVNRAFMPTYAKSRPGAAEIPSMVRNHVRVAFAVHSVLLLFGFAVIEIVLPPAYRERSELFPLLALGALAYGLYFIPMNGLTLIAGRTSLAPLISLTALAVNLGLNFTLDSIWGLWGAVFATALGYSALTLIALLFETRTRSIPWRSVLRRQPLLLLTCGGIVAATLLATWSGPARTSALIAVPLLALAAIWPAVRQRTGLALGRTRV